MRPGARLPAVLAWIAAGAAVVGLATGAPEAGAVAGFGLAAFTLAWARVQLPARPELRLEAPAALVLGRPSRVRLVVRNVDRRPVSISPLLDASASLEVTELPEVVVGPGDVLALEVEVTAQRRGHVELGPLRAWVGGSSRLLEIRHAWEGAGAVPVVPEAAAQGSLRARQLRRGRPLTARRAGRGTELDRLRAYEPGDELRHVHWPASARLGRPITRVMRDEDAPRVLLAIEASRRMAAPDGPPRTRMDRAVEAALGLGASLSSHRVGLVTFDRRVLETLPAVRSAGAGLARVLGPLQPSAEEPDFQELMRHLHDEVRRRSLVVLLGCPEGDELARALPLLHGRHRVIVATLGDRELRRLAGRGPHPSPVQDLAELHARASAVKLLAERRRGLARLRRSGVTVLDVEAAEAERQVRAACLAALSRGV